MLDFFQRIVYGSFFPLKLALPSSPFGQDISKMLFMVVAVLVFMVIFFAAMKSISKTSRDKRFNSRQQAYHNETNRLNQQYSQLPYAQPQQAGEPLPVSDDELFRRMADARENAKRQTTMVLVGVLVCLLFSLFFAPLGIVAAIFGFLYMAKNGRTNEYTMLYKENIVRKALARHFQNLSYSPYTGIHPGKIRNTGLIKLGQTFDSEDYVKGTQLGIDFEQADVDTYTKGDNSQTTYFKGRWIVLKLNKSIDSVLCVYDKSFPYYKSAPSMSYKLEKIELEDVAFNEKYRVISSNPHSAFYVLTPQVMSNLSKITAYMSRGGHMPLAFFMYGNEVHIAVHNAQNAFEIATNEPLDGRYMEQKIAYEVQLITDVINIFTKYF